MRNIQSKWPGILGLGCLVGFWGGAGADPLREGYEAFLAGEAARTVQILEPNLGQLREKSRAALWVFLAYCQQGQFERALQGLTAYRERYQEKGFAASLVAFYCHHLAERPLRAQAQDRRQKTLLNYYLGAFQKYYEGDSRAAERLFQQCLALGDREADEYRLAQTEGDRRGPGRGAPNAASRYRIYRHPSRKWGIKYPPDWQVDVQGEVVMFRGSRANVGVSYWAQEEEDILAQLRQTAEGGDVQVTQAGQADLGWADLTMSAWFVEGYQKDHRTRHYTLALRHGRGWLLLLLAAAPQDFLWQRAYFDLMVQSLAP